MKLIIGIHDRELARNIAIIVSGKKIIPIEAISTDDIYVLLQSHPEAMLLCDETSIEFYQMLKITGNKPDIYLLCHPSLSSENLLRLTNQGIKFIIPYTEDVHMIVNTLTRQLSLQSSVIKTEDKSFMIPDDQDYKMMAIHLADLDRWIQGELLGFNSSKVSVRIEDIEAQKYLLECQESDHVMMYLQGLYINIYADLVLNKQNIFVFRYRNISKYDEYRLAYYINYCQKQLPLQHETVGIESDI